MVIMITFVICVCMGLTILDSVPGGGQAGLSFIPTLVRDLCRSAAQNAGEVSPKQL